MCPFFILNTIFSKLFLSFCNNWMEQFRQIYSNFRKSEYYLRSILKFIRPSPNSTYNCFNTKSIKHFTRLRLGWNHLRYHKFKHGFLDILNPICSCGFDVETTCHFLLHCPNFINKRSLLQDNVSGLKVNCLLVTLQLLKVSFMVMIHWIW